MNEPSSVKQNATAAINQGIQAQFGPAAAAYTHSAVHSDPDALGKVVGLACPKPGDVALDVATGAGHVALALAPHVRQVTAYDMTEGMLLETRRNAAARGLANVVTQAGIAERLPFPDSTFDIVTVRHAPHHFADVQAAVQEMARVAKIGARVVIVDSTSPEDDSLDLEWNQIEKLRDRSHVRSYRPSAWRSTVAGAGLRTVFEQVDYCLENGGPLNFVEWTRRINTPREAVEELRQIFHAASPALVEALRIQVTEEAMGFQVPQIWIAAVR